MESGPDVGSRLGALRVACTGEKPDLEETAFEDLQQGIRFGSGERGVHAVLTRSTDR